MSSISHTHIHAHTRAQNTTVVKVCFHNISDKSTTVINHSHFFYSNLKLDPYQQDKVNASNCGLLYTDLYCCLCTHWNNSFVFYSFTYASSIQQVEKNVLYCSKPEALKVLKLLMHLAWAPSTPA